MLTRNAAKLALGEFGSRVPLLVLELMLARAFGPTLYGIWSIIQTFATYGNFLHLGTASSLARREPGLIECGALDELKARRAATYGLQSIVIIVITLIIITVWMVVGDIFVQLGGIATILALLLVIFAQQLTITTQASAINEYKVLPISIARLIYGFTFFFMGLLVIQYQLSLFWLTLLWAGAIFLALGVLNILTGTLFVMPKIDTARTSALIWDGFPIMFQGLLRFGLVSVDKFVVFSAARPDALGYYGLAALSGSISGLTGTMIARVSLPTLLRFKEQQHGEVKLHQEFEKMTCLINFIMFGVVLLICSYFPIFAFTFLKAYMPAVNVVGILVIAGGFAGFAQAMSEVAMSFGVKAKVLTNTLLTLLIQIILLIFAWSLGAKIELIASSVLVAMLFMSVRAYWVAIIAVGLQKALLRRLVQYVFASTILIVLSFGLLELQLMAVSFFSTDPHLFLIFNTVQIIIFLIYGFLANRWFKSTFRYKDF